MWGVGNSSVEKWFFFGTPKTQCIVSVSKDDLMGIEMMHWGPFLFVNATFPFLVIFCSYPPRWVGPSNSGPTPAREKTTCIHCRKAWMRTKRWKTKDWTLNSWVRMRRTWCRKFVNLSQLQWKNNTKITIILFSNIYTGDVPIKTFFTLLWEINK